MRDDQDEGRSLELRQYFAVVRRRWYVVVVGLMVGVLGGLGYLSTTPKTVTATSSVNVNVISSQPFDNAKPDSQLFDPETEIQLATSAQVLGSAATLLHNDKTLTQMRADTVIQPVAGATIVKVMYTAATQAQAIKGADTIATDYLDYRSTAAATKVNKVVNQLGRQRDSLSKALLGANRRLNNAQVGSPQAVQADSDRQLINLELTSLVAQINALDSVDTSGGTVISPASQNAVTVSPNSTLVLAAGALLGLILGVVLAFLVNALGRRVVDGRALTAIGGGAILSELSARHARIPAAGTDLDQIRSLRERLLASLPSGGTLVVVDLVIRNRPSDVAVNLALSMVEGGDPVRLVLPDHTDEQVALLTGVLDLEPEESSTATTTLTSRWAPGLRIVLTREDAELGAPGTRLGTILAEHDEPQLTTLVSMPPNAPRSLWLTAGRLGHSIILVAARRETRISAVRQLVGELGAVGAVIHGSVLVPRRRTVDMTPVKRAPASVPRVEVDESDESDESDMSDRVDQVDDTEADDVQQADDDVDGIQADDEDDEADEADAADADTVGRRSPVDEREVDTPLGFDEPSTEAESDQTPARPRASSGRA